MGSGKNFLGLVAIFTMLIGYASCGSDSPTSARPPRRWDPLLETSITYRAGQSPCSVFSADLDGDGDDERRTHPCALQCPLQSSYLYELGAR